MTSRGDIFANEIKDSYVKQGWEVQNPSIAEEILSFRPDLLLRRGNEHLVVEIKRPGVSSQRSISDLRERVEKHPNWHFEIKFLPPQQEMSSYTIAEEEASSRLILANDLADSGYHDDAFLLAWVVIEASLNRLTETPTQERRPVPIPELLRAAYEEGRISDLELRFLIRGLEIRNQIVHGYAPKIDKDDAVSYVQLARTLVDQIGINTESHQLVYIFQCSNDHSRYGATLNKDGSNLPAESCKNGTWKYHSRIILGPSAQNRIALNEEELRRALENYGYFLWNVSISVTVS